MEKNSVKFNFETMNNIVRSSWDLLISDPGSPRTKFASDLAFFYDTNVQSYSTPESCLKVLFETFIKGKPEEEEMYLSFQK